MPRFTDIASARELAPSGPGAAACRSRRRGRTGLRSGLLLLAAGVVLGLLAPALAAQEGPARPAPRASTGADGANADDNADRATFRVVIHADNPAVELEATKVSRMFRKKVRRWDHGARAQPVDLGFKSPIREAFTSSVHGTSVTADKSFWQRMIFMGRDVPPEEKSSDQQVLDFVRANPGAIGYVAAETALPTGVKELKITQ